VLATELERKLAFDLRGSWQARVVAATSGPFRKVLLSVIAHTYEEAGVDAILTLIDPSFDGRLSLPGLSTAAKIDKTGAIVADVIDRSGLIHKDEVIFVNEMQMRDAFRALADRVKLNDADRIEFFKVVQRWVVADRRLDPNLDPRDPDAKRLRAN